MPHNKEITWSPIIIILRLGNPVLLISLAVLGFELRARQALYDLSHDSSHFCLGLFFK
jgi:hypothetical protein